MSFLTREYPFGEETHHVRGSIAWGVVIFLLLYLLQPFGFSLYEGNKLLVASMFGVITFACCLVYAFGIFRPMQKRREKWKIWHIGVATLGLILLNGIANWLYFSYVFQSPVTISFFLRFLYWAFIFGCIITAISLYTSYNRYLKGQIEVLRHDNTEDLQGISVTIQDQNVRGCDLSFSLNALLYVEARKNNVMVCYADGEKLAYREVHTTLSTVIDSLGGYGNIFRCHRSFLVNLNHVTSAQGNSNGYKLTLKGCAETIPVSRSYVAQLRQLLA